jgi:UDP-2-acetamido-3-amino-2,3-dideoxy-glucuronate N-acetyltransferase
LAKPVLSYILYENNGVPMSEKYAAHDTARIDSPVEIGAGTSIWHFSHIMPGVQIGADCNIGQNVYIDRDVIIGNGCKIQNNVSVYKGVTLADEVFCGPSMVFTNVINPRAFIERKHEFRSTQVGRGATLGANCTIVCGWDIGEYAMVGAGAVVTSHVPAYGLVLGVPGRHVGWVCQCGVRLPAGDGELACSECTMSYRVGDKSIAPISAS